MTEIEIRRHLTAKQFARKIYTFESIDSTNTYAKTLAAEGEEEGTIVVAEEQREGRGRFTRRWHSTPQQNLTFSIILRPALSPEKIGIVSLFAAVAVCQSIENLSSLRPLCKWPNDLLIDRKKICGILSEAHFHQGKLDSVVVGIGLNVNQQKFSTDLQARATSLALETQQEYDRPLLLANIVQELETFYPLLHPSTCGNILELWNKRTSMIGKLICVQLEKNVIQGRAKRIDEDGGLIITMDEGERKILAGDVTILS